MGQLLIESNWSLPERKSDLRFSTRFAWMMAPMIPLKMELRFSAFRKDLAPLLFWTFLKGSPRDDMSFLKEDQEDHEMILPRNVNNDLWITPRWTVNHIRTAWEDKSLGFQGWSSDLGVPHYSKTNLGGVGNAQLVDSCLETDGSLPLIIINKYKKWFDMV